MTNQSPSTKIYIKYSSYTEVIKKANYDDEWDRDDTSTSHYVDEVSLQPISSEYCYIPFNVKKGDTIYLVYAIWSTGDSFHRADGERIDFISVHKTYSNAKRNEDILSHAVDGDGTPTIFLDDGTEYKYSPGWFGYFESLDYINIGEFVVT